jgi:hypothetical protein
MNYETCMHRENCKLNYGCGDCVAFQKIGNPEFLDRDVEERMLVELIKQVQVRCAWDKEHGGTFARLLAMALGEPHSGDAGESFDLCAMVAGVIRREKDFGYDVRELARAFGMEPRIEIKK